MEYKRYIRLADLGNLIQNEESYKKSQNKINSSNAHTNKKMNCKILVGAEKIFT